MSVRQRGLLLFLGGVAVFFTIAYLLAHPDQSHFTLPATGGPLTLISVGTPGAFAMVGLVELVSGKPIRELESTWAGFAWWEKLILGVLLVIVGTAFVVPVVFFVLVWVALKMTDLQKNPGYAMGRGIVAFLKIGAKVILAMGLVFVLFIVFLNFLDHHAEDQARDFCAAIERGSDISLAVQRFEKERGDQTLMHFETAKGEGHTFVFPGVMFDKAYCDVELDANGKVTNRHSHLMYD